MKRIFFPIILFILIILNLYCNNQFNELSVENGKNFCLFLIKTYEDIDGLFVLMMVRTSSVWTLCNSESKNVDLDYFKRELLERYNKIKEKVSSTRYRNIYPMDSNNSNWVEVIFIVSNDKLYRNPAIFNIDFIKYLEDLNIEEHIYNLDKTNIEDFIYLISLIQYKLQSINLYLGATFEAIK